ncbi:hypothetical protein BsWGS_13963 [Bradybaena similaris]
MDSDYYDDMDMEYPDESMNGMSHEEFMEMLENYDGELTPELQNLMNSYSGSRSNFPPVDYIRPPLSELAENCIIPTCLQVGQMLVSLFIMCFVFQLLCQLGRIGIKDVGVPQWVIHASSAAFGIIALHSFFNLTLLYVVACCVLSYILFQFMCSWKREWCGLAGASLVVLFSVLCELFIVEPATWHRIRGAQIILSMKVISLAVDVGKGSVQELPSMLEYMGYCFNVGTVIFGPWISYSQYCKLLDKQPSPISFLVVLKVFTTTACAFVCFVHSNCLTNWLILDNVWRWFRAYRDAQSFRFSHYFISFLSDATATLSGITPVEGSSFQWSVVRPQHIELPRSLVEVVTNWNLPMHYWLKTYVFKSVRPYGTFLAVILTYAASSLLHGLNFQLAAVLFSLGFYSYTEFVFRQRLSQVFDACIQAKKCKEKCDHKYTSRHPLVILTNLCFGALTMFHLAYLGLMFDSSDGEEKGYTMWHTLDKWSGLDFVSHWVALGTFILYVLI